MLEVVTMADLEKRRNGLYVVCGGERELLFTFKLALQLNTSLCQL
jgi:hypothetical protein